MNLIESDINKYYLSQNLIISNSKIYYINDNNYIKITNCNWHKYLNGYGWEKLVYGWKRRLNKYNNTKNTNSCWAAMDVSGDGDCLFSVVSVSLNNELYYDSNNDKNSTYDSQYLRNIAADFITDENYDIILESYRIEYDNNEFQGNWKPNDITSIDELRYELQQTGNNFWGDHIIIQLLQKALDTYFIILNNDMLDNTDDDIKLNIDSRFTIHNLTDNIEAYKNIIILYYIDGLHFQLVGHFNNGKMSTKFTLDTLPSDLYEIYKIDTRNL
jgi:hypothetical protein